MSLINNLVKDKVSISKELINNVYEAHTKPWVIGYSGGKDSTVITQLILDVILEKQNKGEKLKNKIFIISSDTLVENPLVGKKIHSSIKAMNFWAVENGLDHIVSATVIKPEAANTFWVNVIGRGYPVPNQTFRWCTDRLKIAPANKFILDVVAEYGEVIMVLGVRLGESNSRDQVLGKRKLEGQDLMVHSTLANAFTFAPIIGFDVSDVWSYLLKNENLWEKGSNEELYKMYADSSDGECPLVIDASTKDAAGSCGNSRFGCWSCTVVAKDKSLTGFLKNGEYPDLEKLLDLRNRLALERDIRENRTKIKNNGSTYFVTLPRKGENLIITKKTGREEVIIPIEDLIFEPKWPTKESFILTSEHNVYEYIKNNKIDLEQNNGTEIIVRKTNGDYAWFGLGPYTINYRMSVLEELLQISYNYDLELISIDEVLEVANLMNSAEPIRLYNKYMGEVIDEKIITNTKLINENDISLLREISKNNHVDIRLVMDLLEAESKHAISSKKNGINKKIESILVADRSYLALTGEENEDY